MSKILVICSDIETLKEIVRRLPDDVSDPMAAKDVSNLPDRLPEFNISVAVVHESLEASDERILEILDAADPTPETLHLSSNPEGKETYDKALKFPIPGPVFRNALRDLRGEKDEGPDLEKWKEFYEHLKDEVERIESDETNYYEMLGVDKDAQHQEILNAFDRVSQRYHPDRFSQHRDKKWGRAIYSGTEKLYRKLTEAYEVLKDRNLREKYDRKLKKGQTRMDVDTGGVMGDQGPEELSDLGETKQGKKFLRMAQADLAKDNLSGALQNLEFAQNVESDNDRIADKIEELKDRQS